MELWNKRHRHLRQYSDWRRFYFERDLEREVAFLVERFVRDFRSATRPVGSLGKPAFSRSLCAISAIPPVRHLVRIQRAAPEGLAAAPLRGPHRSDARQGRLPPRQ